MFEVGDIVRFSGKVPNKNLKGILAIVINTNYNNKYKW